MSDAKQPPRDAGGHGGGGGPGNNRGADDAGGHDEDPTWNDEEWNAADWDAGDVPVYYTNPEFRGAGPVPEGFGFRSGMRSARTVLGFAWFVLIMATLLLLMGVFIFVGKGEWLPVALLVLLELGFIAVFLVLAALARQRRNER